jgi:rRNA processing protein Gar1
MKPIGKVVSISNGKLIVKTNKAHKPDKELRTGEKVFDDSGNFVGNIHEYFGPTKNPFLIISPKKNADHYQGRELFI